MKLRKQRGFPRRPAFVFRPGQDLREILRLCESPSKVRRALNAWRIWNLKRMKGEPKSTNVILGLVRELYPKMVADMLVNVQPMPSFTAEEWNGIGEGLEVCRRNEELRAQGVNPYET